MGLRRLTPFSDSFAGAGGAEPIALDGLVYGIDLLDALLVLHLGDAHLYALWVRPDTGLRADDLATPLRDASEWSGNFRGWEQYRKRFAQEHASAFPGEAPAAAVH